MLLVMVPHSIAKEPALTGEEALKRCKAAYAALKTYSGDTEVSKHMLNSKGQAVDRERSSAHVIFQQPDRLRVDGTLLGSRPTGYFHILSNGNKTWKRWTKEPEWTRSESVEMAIASLTGVSGGAATKIPAILAQTWWGDPFPVNVEEIDQIVVRETIQGKPLYRVRAKSETSDVTFWIDPKTMLLARMRERVDIAKLLTETKDLLSDDTIPMDARDAAMKLTGVMETLEIYTNVSVNGPVPAKTFALPRR